MEFARESKIAEILSKVLIEDLSMDEEKILAGWLAESKANHALYERIVSGTIFPEQEEIHKHYHAAQGIRNITFTLRRRKWRRMVVTSVSAAAILIVGILNFKYIHIKDPSDIPIMASLETHPAGTPKAILFYEDSQIFLTEEEQESEWEKYVKPDDAKNDVQQAQYLRIEVPRSGEYKLTLNDGTQVWLNSESSIEYLQGFTNEERAVKLTGEAYFEVATDRVRPFIVEFGDARIKVLATSFNVSAYTDDYAATATLVSGVIEISRQGVTRQLVPGKQAVLHYNSFDIVVNDVDVSNYALWTKGIFEFENMRLQDICRRLSRWYDVKFEFESAAGDEKFTGGTWKYLPLGEFLAGIEKVTDLTFSYTDDTVMITSN